MLRAFQWWQTGSEFDNYQLRITLLCLHFTITYRENSIVILKSNTRKSSTTWARETVSERQMPLRAEFAHSCCRESRTFTNATESKYPICLSSTVANWSSLCVIIIILIIKDIASLLQTCKLIKQQNSQIKQEACSKIAAHLHLHTPGVGEAS